MNMLKQFRFVIAASIVLCAVYSVYALYGITNEGAWPQNWPKELEPLRKQSRSWIHSQYCIHEIPFTSRAEFEAAWPHILAVKSKEAPLILLRSPSSYRNMGEPIKAGVRYLSPRTGIRLITPEKNAPTIGPPWPDHIKSESGALPEYAVNANGKWMSALDKKAKEYYTHKEYNFVRARIDIELIVDGNIVDLNRIPLPMDTPIIDKRFK